MGIFCSVQVFPPFTETVFHAMYGPQGNDIPLNYNLYFLYEPGSRTERGLIGHLINGWSFAPVLTWNDGGWDAVNVGIRNNVDCQSFGEGDCSAESTNESAVKVSGYNGGANLFQGTFNPTTVGSGSNVTFNANGTVKQNGTGMNRFGDNALAFYNLFRPMVLGLDTTGESGLIRGFSFTNIDFSLTKDLAISEKYHTELNAQATNVLNHFSPSTSSLNISQPTNFGAINGSSEGPRTVEVGLAVRW